MSEVALRARQLNQPDDDAVAAADDDPVVRRQ